MAGYSLFLERALQKILSDRETRRSQHAKLKQKCEQALERLQATCKEKSGKHAAVQAPSVSDVEYYYLVLEHVCQSRSPRLVSAALDCLQKLIAPGYLTGLSPDPDNPSKPLIDRIVDTVCTCFNGVNTDDDVQLQIIKALLTMMTSASCSVHEGSLLQVIRTCYNIYLASKKPINQATAKTTLTQIIHVVFQRMEQQKEESELEAQALHASGAVATTSAPTPSSSTRLERPNLPAATGTPSPKTDRSMSLGAQYGDSAAVISVEQALAVPTDDEIMQEITATGFGSQEIRSRSGTSPGLLRASQRGRYSGGPSPAMSRSGSTSDGFPRPDAPGGDHSPSVPQRPLQESVPSSSTDKHGAAAGTSVEDASGTGSTAVAVAGQSTAPPVDMDTGQEPPGGGGGGGGCGGDGGDGDGGDGGGGDGGDGSGGGGDGDGSGGRDTVDGAVSESTLAAATSQSGDTSAATSAQSRNEADTDAGNAESSAASANSTADASMADGTGPMQEEDSQEYEDANESVVADCANYSTAFDIVKEVEGVLGDIVEKVVSEKQIPAMPATSTPRAVSPATSMTIVGPNTVAYVASETSSSSAGDARLSAEPAHHAFESSWGFEHVVQKDGFLVFRSLCKLSMKAIDSHDPRSHELRSKILSLELLLSVLDGAGVMLRTDPMFINAIKQYLCVALSKNGVSSVPQVFELSLSIFLALLNNFKEHLKMQIEVFFKEIFLNILQSTTSSFQHKLLVTLSLRNICKDPQCIVNIYLNYDCDLSLANIFERLVGDIAHIAQGSNAVLMGHPTQQQEKAIQFAGMECLVGILQSLVTWTSDLYVRPGMAALAQKSAGIETAFPYARDPVSVSDKPKTGLPLANNDTSPLPRNGRVRESPVESASSSQSLAGLDLPEEFEVIKKKKDVMEEGLARFHKKPRHGIKFLQENDLLGTEPSDVALFFHTDDRLEPVSVGEYLGEADKYCIEVMYSYVDMLEFHEMPFVPALRMFLAGFRLPGEAQKIDRLMEKFAGRYCESNSGASSVFASADTAYVLAYSIIMLATDLHSTKIKREQKMTKEQYIKMNRGINDQKDLPSEYLESIYDEIAKQEITLRGGNKAAKQPAPTGITDKTRQQLNDAEMEQMAQTAKAMMEDRSRIQTHFIIATRTEHARPMFKVAWTPFLAALSVALREDAGDERIVALCLEGFRAAIRVAAIFDAKLERNAFVQTLAKFTLLTNISGVGEMKRKHIETAKILISVAHTEGNYLQETWVDVLNVVSHLELAQSVGSDRQRLKNGSIAGGASAAAAAAAAAAATSATTSTGGGRDSIVAQASFDSRDSASWGKVDSKTLDETISQPVVVAIDRIFTDSNLLDGNAILDFVNGLISASFAELESRPAPRMFSLQKIVEISYYNMGRIRLEWSRIWAIIGEYFNKVGCHSNEDVAVFAIDSLRQLSMKFLERGELANFRFQKDFLRPFEYIMKRNLSPVIRDMVVSCMAQMVHYHAKNIRSGWKNIFAVFHLAASDHDPQIVELAFETTSNIFEKHFAATIAASFQDAVKCLAEFSCNAAFPDTSMEAIRRIDMCARCVAQQPNIFRDVASMEESMDAEDRVWVRGWFPVLFELSCIISRCKLDVRTRALTVMFNIMKTYGAQFLSHWWRDVFNVIFRIFDNMKLPEQQVEKTEWMTTTCPHTLMCIVDVFSQYFDALAPVLLDNLYSQFSWSAQQDNKELAIASLDCLESFVTTNGGHFSRLYWDKTVDCVEKIFSATLPQALLGWRSEETGNPGAPYDVPLIHIHIPRKASMHSMVPSVTQTRESFHSSKSTSGVGSTTTGSGTSSGTVMAMDVIDGADSQHAQSDRTVDGDSGSVLDVACDGAGSTGQPEHSDQSGYSLPASAGSSPLVGATAENDSWDSTTADPRSSNDSPGLELEPPRTSSEAKQRVFGTLDVRCHVQQCLIRAIDHIVFSSVGSKHQDQRLFYAAAREASHLPTPSSTQGPISGKSSPAHFSHGDGPSAGSPEAMFPLLSSAQLLRLVYLLMASHDFAKLFNADNEQRAALWKAGFQGKAKINMWKQETQSLLCVLRILFSMVSSQQHASCAQSIDTTLINIWQNAIAYYCTLTSANHRLEWLPVLLFLIDNLKQLEPARFDRHLLKCGAKILYKMVTVDMQAELRCVLRDLLEHMHDRACFVLDQASADVPVAVAVQ